MAEEYDEILDDEFNLWEKLLAFLQGDEDEPVYKNFEDKVDYVVYDRGNWFGSFGKNAFTDETKATIGQATLRRENFDTLLCIDRTLVLHEYSRKDFYELEAERTEEKLVKNRFDQANYISAKEALGKNVLKNQ